MFCEDITGSIAHAQMLAHKNIIQAEEAELIVDGLCGILDDMKSGELKPDPNCEDIHMFVEQVLTERIGDTGKKLHTARVTNIINKFGDSHNTHGLLRSMVQNGGLDIRLIK